MKGNPKNKKRETGREGGREKEREREREREKGLEASECRPHLPVLVIEYGVTSSILDFHSYKGTKVRKSEYTVSELYIF